MPGFAAQVTDERELLAGFLRQQQDAFRNAAFGLTDEQAGTRVARSALTVGSLVKHAAGVQYGWRLRIESAPEPPTYPMTFEEARRVFEEEHQWLPGDTLAAAIERLDAESEATLAAIRSADLDAAVPVPHDAPWFPRDVERWSVRWVVLHLIEELARHAGHADLIREGIDGATMYELMAGREGWPATEWLTPWHPDGVS